MRRQLWFSFLLAGFLILTCSGCNVYGSPGHVKVLPKAMTIMISSNTVSNFTPCGCHSGKWGGLPRRGTIFANAENEVDWPVLFVDTGDVVQGSISELQTLKDNYIFEAYDILDYDVVNIGYSDLNMGYERLAEVGTQYNIPWISANTYTPGEFPDLPIITQNTSQAPSTLPPGSSPGTFDPEAERPQDETTAPPPTVHEPETDPLFLPYMIIEPDGAPGYRIGFIGMMMQDAGRLNPKRETFSFEPYTTAIQRNVSFLRNEEKVDLVILVSDNDNFDNVDTETVFAGIDIVIGGRTNVGQSPNSTLNPDNPLYRPPPPQRGTSETPDTEIPEETEPVFEPLDLPLIVPKGAGRARLIRRFDIFLDGSGRIVDYYTTEFRVDDTNVDDPRLAEVARKYDTDVLAVELMGRVQRTYAGSLACEECHPGFLSAWSDQGHFNAYQTIVNENALDDRECTRCHAIGFVEEPRLLTYDLVAESHRDVGCEGCHPSGARHITFQNHLATLTPEARVNVTTPDTMETEILITTCTPCHTGEWAQDFNFIESMDAARALCQSVDVPAPVAEPEDITEH